MTEPDLQIWQELATAPQGGDHFNENPFKVRELRRPVRSSTGSRCRLKVFFTSFPNKTNLSFLIHLIKKVDVAIASVSGLFQNISFD